MSLGSYYKTHRKAVVAAASAVVGFAVEAVAMGVLHGTAEHVAEGVIAVAAVLGIHTSVSVSPANEPAPGTVPALPNDGAQA